MKFRQLLFTALLTGFAGLLSASTAHTYQQNYTCEGGPENCAPEQSYAPIRWGHNCVDFYLDREGSPDFQEPGTTGASKELEDIVERSFESWSEPACSGISLSYKELIDPSTETSEQQRNIVSFRPADSSETSAMVFATTYVSYNPNTGAISDADIHINSEFYEFADDPEPDSGKADLQNTLTHEVGHLLGFAHSMVIEATMFGGAELGETHKRTLHEDDIALLCLSYPSDGADLFCETSGSNAQSNIETDSKHDISQNPSSPGLNDNNIGADLTDSGCNVTGGAGSATLGPWFFIFGLLLLRTVQTRGLNRSRAVR